MIKEFDFKFTGQSLTDLALAFIADIPIERGELYTTPFIASPSYVAYGKDKVIEQIKAVPALFTAFFRSRDVKVGFWLDKEEQVLGIDLWTKDETLSPWLNELEERIRQALAAVGQSGKPIAA